MAETSASCSLPDRRSFLQVGATTVATALSAGRVLGANERIGVGFIGFGLIGKRHVLTFKELADIDPVAVAEVHRGRLDEAKELIGGNVKGYTDFRKLLDDKNVHAVVIATPDHWHALMTMLACEANKDVYVEKPVTLFPQEGPWMLDMARRHKRVVQVGTQQRSGPHYQKARELLQSGHIGKIVAVRMESYRNIVPGFGSPADGNPPDELDWDSFLGPAPLRKYNANRGLYHFRWFWDTSGGQMTNLGHHSLDIVDWVMKGIWPLSVVSMGGRFALKDHGETPDTQDALFEFPDFTVSWSHREASRGQPGTALEFCGTKGSMTVSRSGFEVFPDRKIAPENSVPQFSGAHPVGGPKRVPEDKTPTFWTEALKDESGNATDQFKRHAQNFLDCIRSREQPVSDLESGQRVSTICHLANISLRLRRQVRWNADKGTIPGDEEAARMLVRSYRPPQDTVLQRLLKGSGGK